VSELLTRNRLRLPNGKKVENASDYLNYIEKSLLKSRPMSPKEISIALVKSTKQTHRYLNALLDMKKVAKIEGSSKYKLIDSKITKSEADLQKKIETMSEFFEAETVKRFMTKCTVKARTKHNYIIAIGRMCTGKKYPEFKIHPDNWIHPETTELIIELERKLTKTQRVNPAVRRILRSWLDCGVGVSLESEKSELRKMGLMGDKNKPQTARLHMLKEQYENAKTLLKNDHLNLCKFGFRYWTFCRPSSMYIVKTDDLIFYDREVKFIEIEGQKITDEKMLELFKEKYEVKSLKHRACMIQDLKEHKTDENYVKYIFDETIVKALEKLVIFNKKQGLRFLFWHDSKTNFTFENYDTIVIAELTKDNETFKEIFEKCGFKKEDFGSSFRANYALRHFGVQWWLQETDYDYGLIASMGWKDINTLRDWYGQMTAQHFEKKISGILP